MTTLQCGKESIKPDHVD